MIGELYTANTRKQNRVCWIECAGYRALQLRISKSSLCKTGGGKAHAEIDSLIHVVWLVGRIRHEWWQKALVSGGKKLST